MPIIPWRPFRDIDKWFEESWPDLWEMPESLAVSDTGLKAPRMDIYEKGNDLIVDVELPGMEAKDIDIEVKDNFLKVEAKKEEKKEEKKKGYYRKEISSGYYKRVVPLPAEVKGESASASYDNGLLKIVIPKKKIEKDKKRKVRIKVGKSKN